jgi:ribosome-binding protein aMBF1 (putative translation factor)
VARKKTRNALELIARDAGSDPALWRRVEQEKLNAQVAQVIYDARTEAKLTQKQLAELVGTTQPVIARLEDADYEGHSLTMLRRIAEALDRRVEVRLLPKRRTLQRA